MLSPTLRRQLLNILLPMGLSFYAVVVPRFATAAGAPSADTLPPLQEVTVIGKVNDHTLNLQIQEFVQSHARPSALIGQIGRWRNAVCPVVSGLQDVADAVVARRITSVAQAVGAPRPAAGKKCTTNVEVVFTASPQQLLDHIADKYHALLGFYRTSEHKQILTFSHPIQAWYMTGTRSLYFSPPQTCFYDCPIPQDGMGRSGFANSTSPFSPGLEVDSDQTAGGEGSYGATGGDVNPFTHGLRSEFLHVLVIVDSKAVAKYQLTGISDYVAMLALTRLVSLDDCSGLPSIVNLFAAHCADVPATITTADIAYLKGLYSADLDKDLNFELRDMHEGMRRVIQAP